MSQLQYQSSGDSPIVAFQEDNGELDSFFAKMKSVGWNQASFDEEHQKLATYNEIMIFFVKVFVLLALMLTTFYVMAFIFLVKKVQIIKNGEIVQYHFIIYILSCVITILMGRWAYFSESSRKFPLNIFCYLFFTSGAAYVFGQPLSLILQGGYYSGQDWIILLYLSTMTLGTYLCIIIFTFCRQTPQKPYIIIFSVVGVMIFLLFIFLLTAPYYLGLLVASFACHVLYGCLLVIDIKLITQGKFSLRTNQYVSGALYLYLDITFMIFYFIGCILAPFGKCCVFMGQCCEICCRIIPHKH
ncbi:unnamed protein product (macronuclear) [Paramecium tetraurelia]|uniref:Uncharacterized protein n=1 Tax=Paramecium tetraurelia TaxID=5888 RepID=A0BZM3_PARTE|nr:uncharacterized protein GSPATT00005842001 [Paramecium tetraurelia]CAK63990.1 unnamed protein product [Paramecium tetraurelia]|eukprot:XP_001431388.1 hypothetical protein (macronuclear) [Paramecium tetraurelia strain d4-2]